MGAPLDPEVPLFEDVVLPPPVLVLVLVPVPLLFVALLAAVPVSVAALALEVALLAPTDVCDSEAEEKLRLIGVLQEIERPVQMNKVTPRKFFSGSCPRAPELVVARDDRI